MSEVIPEYIDRYRAIHRLRDIEDLTPLREAARLFGKNGDHTTVVDDFRNKLRGALYDLGFNEGTSSSSGYSTFTRSWQGREEFLCLMMSWRLSRTPETKGSFEGYDFVMSWTVMENTKSNHTYSADVMFAKQITFDDLYDDLEQMRTREKEVLAAREQEKIGIKALINIV